MNENHEERESKFKRQTDRQEKFLVYICQTWQDYYILV